MFDIASGDRTGYAVVRGAGTGADSGFMLAKMLAGAP